MSDLVVLAFDNVTDAGMMRDDLLKMQKEHLIGLDDAAVVVRNQEGKVKVDQIASLTGAGALGGAFWGLLIGLIFFVPIFGLVVGAAAGALAGKYADVGVDDKFIKEVGNTIQPGSSALFLLVRESTPDKVMENMKKYKNVKVLKTSLSKEQEEKLREAFAGENVQASL
ncbi:MAG: DUF1269 domain-containing protein [Methanotrichaceae archaeon]|nr:DUF1269 domain-containing protein [Methanotrichaceae archaeon]